MEKRKEGWRKGRKEGRKDTYYIFPPILLLNTANQSLHLHQQVLHNYQRPVHEPVTSPNDLNHVSFLHLKNVWLQRGILKSLECMQTMCIYLQYQQIITVTQHRRLVQVSVGNRICITTWKQYAKIKGTYDEKLGGGVNYIYLPSVPTNDQYNIAQELDSSVNSL